MGRLGPVQTVAVLITSFGALVAPYAQPLLGPVWHALATSKDRSRREAPGEPQPTTLSDPASGPAPPRPTPTRPRPTSIPPSPTSFVAQVVNQPDAETAAQDSDGNALGPEAVVYALFSVVLAMAEKKAFRYGAHPTPLVIKCSA